MKITPLIIVLLCIVCASCQQKPMHDIDFDSKQHKLIFIASEDVTPESPNTFKRQHNNFYIDDIGVLNKIKNQFIQDKRDIPTGFKSEYDISVVDAKNDQLFNGKLDLSNGVLLASDSYYDFSTALTLIPEKFLKPLEKLRIEVNSMKNAKKLINIIEDHNGIIYGSLNFRTKIKAYNGMTILKVKKDYLNASEITEETTLKVKNDLKKLGDVFVEVSYCNDPDYCTFYIYTEKLNADAIPSAYKIVKPLSDTLLEPIVVYNVSVETLRTAMKAKDFTMDITRYN
ncbi:hypothetical protein [Gelidibacter sediminis]|nr:hypothetical protein [Gelidibacter sediminis]